MVQNLKKMVFNTIFVLVTTYFTTTYAMTSGSLPTLSTQEFNKSYKDRYALDATNTNDKSWVLVWNDEFDNAESNADSALNPSKWQFNLGETWHDEKQYYTRFRKENYRITKDTSSDGYSLPSSSDPESATGILRITPRKDILLNNEGQKTFTQPAPAIDTFSSNGNHRTAPATYESKGTTDSDGSSSSSDNDIVVSGLNEVVVENVRIKYGPKTVAEYAGQHAFKNADTMYTSASITTKRLGANIGGTKSDKSAFLAPNTRIEARIKLPKGQGFHTFFSLMPDQDETISGGYGDWPKSGQIDILENYGNNPTQNYHAVFTEEVNWNKPQQFHFYENFQGTSNEFKNIWANFAPDPDSYKNFEGNPTDFFHIYGVEWLSDDVEGDRINFYRNNITMKTYRPEDFGATPDMKLPSTDYQYKYWPNPPTTWYKYWPFDAGKNFFIEFKIALGGPYSGSVDDANVFDNNPAQTHGDLVYGVNDDKHSLMIDWVRVFKKIDTDKLKTLDKINEENPNFDATIISHHHMLNNAPVGSTPANITFHYEVTTSCDLKNVVTENSQAAASETDDNDDDDNLDDETSSDDDSTSDTTLDPDESLAVCGQIEDISTTPGSTTGTFPYGQKFDVTIKPNLAGGWFLSRVQGAKLNIVGNNYGSFGDAQADANSDISTDPDVVESFVELVEVKEDLPTDDDDMYKLPSPLSPEVATSLSKYPRFYPKYTLTLPAVTDYTKNIFGFQRFGEILHNHDFVAGLTEPNWEINGRIHDSFDFYTYHNNGVPIVYADTSVWRYAIPGQGGMYINVDSSLGGGCNAGQGRWCNQLVQQDIPIVGGRWYTVRLRAKFVPRSMNPNDKKFVEGPFVTNTDWGNYKEYLYPVDTNGEWQSGFYVPTDKFETFQFRKRVDTSLTGLTGADLRARLALNIGKLNSADGGNDPDGVLIINELSIVDEQLGIDQRDFALVQSTVLPTVTTTTTGPPIDNDQCWLEYCNAYDDLKLAFCAGQTCSSNIEVTRCRRHWRHYGRRETRISARRNSPPCIQEKFNYQFDNTCSLNYCNAYVDLKDAFCGGSECTTENQAHDCRLHWYRHGRRETRNGGRTNTPTCLEPFVDPHIPDGCILEYCNVYQDLKNAFCGGNTCTTEVEAQRCRRHWYHYGKRETKTGSRAYNPPCMSEFIHHYQFTDECANSYCNAYTDLKNAFCNGQDCNGYVQAQSCRRHWYNHGKKETRRGGRQDNPECLADKLQYGISQNCAANYCNAFDDLKAAFCNGSSCSEDNYDQAQDCRRHWFNHGKKEIRQNLRDINKTPPCLQHKMYNTVPKECSIAYCNAYPDLKNAFCGGNTCADTWQNHRTCKNHWNKYGRHEGRPNNPDCLEEYEFDFTKQCALEYCNSQPDLQRAYCSVGSTINTCNHRDQGIQCRIHYFRWGRFEERSNIPSCINPVWRRNLTFKQKMINRNRSLNSLKKAIQDGLKLNSSKHGNMIINKENKKTANGKSHSVDKLSSTNNNAAAAANVKVTVDTIASNTSSIGRTLSLTSFNNMMEKVKSSMKTNFRHLSSALLV